MVLYQHRGNKSLIFIKIINVQIGNNQSRYASDVQFHTRSEKILI